MENLFLGVLCAVRRPLFNTAKSETFADHLRSQHTTLSCGKKMVNKQHIYYAGNMVYDDAKVLSYALFEEGMVKPTLSNGQTKFNYEYYLKDHLGNSRVVFKPTGTGPKIEQAAEYYPFGSSFKPMDPNNDNKYLYNGKELQDETLY